jgi:hypothetical protein
MKVAGAYVSSFGLLSLYGKSEPAALVEVSGSEAEILVTNQGRMELSRTAPLEEGYSPQDVAQEIHRTLLSYASRAPGQDVGKIVLAGEGQDAATLADAVGKLLRKDVSAVGPGSLQTATAAGVCSGLLRGASMPDLLHPPVVVRKFKLTRRHRVAALAAGVLVMLFVWGQVTISSKRSLLEAKKQDLAKLQPQAAALTRTIEQTQKADQWYRTRTVWIDILSAIRQNINTRNLWISSANFDDPGVIRLQGKAKDDVHVTDLVSALKRTNKFASISPDRIDTNKGDKPEYKREFTITAVVAGYDPKKKKN